MTNEEEDKKRYYHSPMKVRTTIHPRRTMKYRSWEGVYDTSFKWLQPVSARNDQAHALRRDKKVKNCLYSRPGLKIHVLQSAEATECSSDRR